MSEPIDKIKLIYEFNNDSPLFARVAESELLKGNIEDAVKIAEDGLKKHPGYPSAYLVYAEAYARLNKFDKVIDIMETVKELLDDEKSVNYYLEYFEELRSIEEGKTDRPPKDYEDLDSLADKVSKARIPKIDDTKELKPFEEDNNKSIVSETLAGIYYSQGSYGEALEMYEKLLESNPAKANFYKEKIAEIKNIIGS